MKVLDHPPQKLFFRVEYSVSFYSEGTVTQGVPWQGRVAKLRLEWNVLDSTLKIFLIGPFPHSPVVLIALLPVPLASAPLTSSHQQ